MDFSCVTDEELLVRRHQAFLRLETADHPSDPDRAGAYEEIQLINRELARRRPPGPEREAS